MKRDWKELCGTFFAGFIVGYASISALIVTFMGIANLFIKIPWDTPLFLYPLGIGALVGIGWVLEDLGKWKWTRE